MLLESRRRSELSTVSPAIARKLVDTLFGQATTLAIGAAIFVLLGLIGFVGTGSRWYLGGVVLAACTGIARIAQTIHYKRQRESVTPLVWARRFAWGAWATGAGWGAWSAVVLFEPEKTFTLMVIGAQSACVIGGAVRNCAAPRVANGQVLLTLLPLFAACIASDSIYLNIYTGLVALHILAATGLVKFLHGQTLRLLLQDEEKSDLVARLEAANQDLEVFNQHLETLVGTDALTGVANRRAFDLVLAREWRRSGRDKAPLSLLMIDVDHFKAYNDFYGHPTGDDCLRQVAATLAGALQRPGDFLARYGGEEFVAILPATDLDGAGIVAKALLAAVRARALPHDASTRRKVTVSIGAGCLIPDSANSATELAAIADTALYAAKRGGRNRIHTSTSPANAEVPAQVADVSA